MMARHCFLCSSRKNRLLPFSLRFAGRGLDVQKIVCGGQNGCNITWGYVAWMGIGEGWGRSLLFFIVGGSVSISKNLSRCAETP